MALNKIKKKKRKEKKKERRRRKKRKKKEKKKKEAQECTDKRIIKYNNNFIECIDHQNKNMENDGAMSNSSKFF